jgi:hypothetical protein
MKLNDVRSFLLKLKQKDIIFDPHFYTRLRDRPINEGIVRSFLSQIDKLEKIEIGKIEGRFKLWFKMSRKYSLVLIIEIKSSKDLKVISAWNTEKTWQDKLKQ